ncbi:srek1ip1 family member [Anaeramoeba flamelloides]|uniref:Srek1ip1 family member n=1 Tax=Anaeramoeba flamelloides TaxID=1746091 RepID=A0AAV8A2T0_9EUKA|nr:srek1ip1 family member [Anaeramoeba flamelloides]
MFKRCKQCQKRGFRFLKILQIKTHSRFLYPIIELIPLNVEILCYKCVDQLSRIYQQQLILSQYVTFSFDFYSLSSGRINQQEESSSSESDYLPGNSIKPPKKIKRGQIKRIPQKKQKKKKKKKRKRFMEKERKGKGEGEGKEEGEGEGEGKREREKEREKEKKKQKEKERKEEKERERKRERKR